MFNFGRIQVSEGDDKPQKRNAWTCGQKRQPPPPNKSSINEDSSSSESSIPSPFEYKPQYQKQTLERGSTYNNYQYHKQHEFNDNNPNQQHQFKSNSNRNPFAKINFYNSKFEFGIDNDKYNRKIETKEDVLREIRCKQNPNINNLEDKMINELQKFNQIVRFIIDCDVDEEFAQSAFVELAKTYSQERLISTIDKSKKMQIYHIFFDDTKFIFSKLYKMFMIKEFIMNRDETRITHVLNFIEALILVSRNNVPFLSGEIEILKQLKNNNPYFIKKIESIVKKAESKEDERLIVESDIIPSAADLFDKPALIENNIGRKWENIDQYRNAMFGLTKENFFLPVRKHLGELVSENLDYRDLFLYDDVRIGNVTGVDLTYFSDSNLFLHFHIRSPNKLKIPLPEWKKSDRFAAKSLLFLSKSKDCLTLDAICRSCAGARSENKDKSLNHINLLNKGLVPVVRIWGNIDEKTSYFMFEPPQYWSAVQPVLERLLKMKTGHFPENLEKPILQLDFSKNEIDYDQKSIEIAAIYRNRFRNTYELYGIYQSTNPFEFVEEDIKRLQNDQIDKKFHVDFEQFKALRHVSTHSLTLVNGAPGTGKTHFARELVRVYNESNVNSPIVVLALTNHAIDSFLEGVIDFISNDSILRWGGPTRSTDPRIINRNWSNRFLPKSVNSQNGKIVTIKMHLKNMYNIRQEAQILNEQIIKKSGDFNNCIKLCVLLNMFFDASNIIAAEYPDGLNQNDRNLYNEVLKKNVKGIINTPLPNLLSAWECWFYGKSFYQKRNKTIREIFEKNLDTYHQSFYINKFEILSDNYINDDEVIEEEEEKEKGSEEEKEKGPEEGIKTDTKEEEGKPEVFIKASNEKIEINEEEDFLYETKIFNDEDVLAMIDQTFLSSDKGSKLPKKYIEDVMIPHFKIMVKKNNPSTAMISFLMDISSPLTQMIENIEKKLEEEEAEFTRIETLESANYLKRMKLIAMTSTVASVRKEALEKAGCEILIIEEAGELTESMTSCLLPSTLQQLVLIGDYQQLRPKVEYELSSNPYNYNISLFEKLVIAAKEKKAECLFTLSSQRRMHPQICDLVRNVFYTERNHKNYRNEKIVDHSSTLKLGIPFGFPHRVRFCMNDFEQNNSITRSYSNTKEAQFCAALVPYFICHGYKPMEITIITLYKGQLYEIKRELETLYKNLMDKSNKDNRMIDSFGGVRWDQINVKVLDNFQGEENKIIILSTVRSDKPGFVHERNRALVMLSRAREMLVFLGNRKIFGPGCSDELWNLISSEAEKLSPFCMSQEGQEGIAVNNCHIHNPHNDTPAFLNTPEDLIKYRLSFCKEICGFKLDCGHTCKLHCHCHGDEPTKEEHDLYICQETCLKRCPNGHQCKDTCGICIKRGCPLCHEIVHHKFETCSHEVDVYCFQQTSNTVKCLDKCGKPLDCGHTCKQPCCHKSDCKCTEKLSTTCPQCGKDFKYICGEEKICPFKCSHILECGHQCTAVCADCSKRGRHSICLIKCMFIFPCGHRCNKICSDSYPGHQHFLCEMCQESDKEYEKDRLNTLNQMRGFLFDKDRLLCLRKCVVCRKRCDKKRDEYCIPRCDCRCTERCKQCRAQCRALTGEKCAIFCIHNISNEPEPPIEKGLIYVFHDNHWGYLSDAKEMINNQFLPMMRGTADVPVPITHLYCPHKGCHHVLRDSWYFDHELKEVNNVLNHIKEKATNLIKEPQEINEMRNCWKIHWYLCECGEIYWVKYQNPKSITCVCPHCGMQKGNIFE